MFLSVSWDQSFTSHWLMNSYNGRKRTCTAPSSFLSHPSHHFYGYAFPLTRQLDLQGDEEDSKAPRYLVSSLFIWGFCWCHLDIWCLHSETNMHFWLLGFLSYGISESQFLGLALCLRPTKGLNPSALLFSWPNYLSVDNPVNEF